MKKLFIILILIAATIGCRNIANNDKQIDTKKDRIDLAQKQKNDSTQKIVTDSSNSFLPNFENQFSKTDDLPDTIIPFKHNISKENDNEFSSQEYCSEDSSVLRKKIIITNLQACIYYDEGSLNIITKFKNDNFSRIWDTFYADDNKNSYIENYKIVNIGNHELLELTLKFDSAPEDRGNYTYTRKILLDLENELLLLKWDINSSMSGGSLSGSTSENCSATYKIENKILILSQFDCETSENKLNENFTDKYTATVTHMRGFKPHKFNYQNGLLLKIKN